MRLAQDDRAEATRLLHRALPLARWSAIAPHILQHFYGTMIRAAPDVESARAIVDQAKPPSARKIPATSAMSRLPCPPQSLAQMLVTSTMPAGTSPWQSNLPRCGRAAPHGRRRLPKPGRTWLVRRVMGMLQVVTCLRPSSSSLLPASHWMPIAASPDVRRQAGQRFATAPLRYLLIKGAGDAGHDQRPRGSRWEYPWKATAIASNHRACGEVDRAVVEILAWCGAALSCLLSVPQVVRTLHTDRLDGLSAPTYWIVLINAAVWSAWALLTGEHAAGVPAVINGPAAILILYRLTAARRKRLTLPTRVEGNRTAKSAAQDEIAAGSYGRPATRLRMCRPLRRTRVPGGWIRRARP